MPVSSRLRLTPLLIPLALLGATVPGCDAARVFFPAHIYETESPVLPATLAEPAILLFTKTNGFRHKEAIPAGTRLIEQIAEARGYSLFHTESGAAFTPEILERFAVTIWHNTSGDTLNEEQKQAFRAWLEGGGGFVGVHGAGGDPSYDWGWYVEELLKAQFIGHTMGPQFVEARAVVEDRDHPATRNLPAEFLHTEEWYSFAESPRPKGVRVLMTVDETSYAPEANILFWESDLAMGDHPVVWSHCVGRGRAFYSALGHQAEAYALPEMRALLEGAIAWAAGDEGEDCR